MALRVHVDFDGLVPVWLLLSSGVTRVGVGRHVVRLFLWRAPGGSPRTDEYAQLLATLGNAQLPALTAAQLRRGSARNEHLQQKKAQQTGELPERRTNYSRYAKILRTLPGPINQRKQTKT